MIRIMRWEGRERAIVSVLERFNYSVYSVTLVQKYASSYRSGARGLVTYLEINEAHWAGTVSLDCVE
jgi:hypothetical protein